MVPAVNATYFNGYFRKITNTFRMLATLAIWTCTTGDFVSPQNIPRVFIAILQPLTRITIRPIRMLWVRVLRYSNHYHRDDDSCRNYKLQSSADSYAV
jgi:hypothetical protein